MRAFSCSASSAKWEGVGGPGSFGVLTWPFLTEWSLSQTQETLPCPNPPGAFCKLLFPGRPSYRESQSYISFFFFLLQDFQHGNMLMNTMHFLEGHKWCIPLPNKTIDFPPFSSGSYYNSLWDLCSEEHMTPDHLFDPTQAVLGPLLVIPSTIEGVQNEPP